MSRRVKVCFSKLLFKITKLAIVLTVLYIYFTPKILSRNTDSLQHIFPHRSSNSQINLVIAHPDDEVMFFSPVISQLHAYFPDTVPFNILCLSKGDAEGLGDTRAKELNDSAVLLLRNERPVSVQVMNFEDGMDEEWDIDSITSTLSRTIDVNNEELNQIIVTFDSYGVSNHINHKSCHIAVETFMNDYVRSKAKENGKNAHIAALYLRSYKNNIFLKYNSFIWEILKMLYSTVSPFGKSIQPLPPSTATEKDSLLLMNTHSQYILAYAAMLNAHKSQVVWFRYGWWILSRFVFVNEFDVFTY
ncbi:N-acetylglucosaminylphosphatidylinositol deacetylase [Saccharomyces eubayanus]|uniref:N-acetylglucosaminylphosphatidylinositol deacetylase n=1 Tax=Saccharomyces eubayanus TaxID=1080349 RepID=UPI0006C27CED|nr:GPI12-like protein [Saccharomyces eubayanus]KOG97610.1 GPI12-like protein [Saccharomyces eubayanus]